MVWQAVLETAVLGVAEEIYMCLRDYTSSTGIRTLPERYPSTLARSSAPNHDPAMIDIALTHARWSPAPPTPSALDRCLQAGLQAMLLVPTFCGLRIMPPCVLACQPPACSLERLRTPKSGLLGSAKRPPCGALKGRKGG
jgi:hypothetical protein